MVSCVIFISCILHYIYILSGDVTMAVKNRNYNTIQHIFTVIGVLSCTLLSNISLAAGNIEAGKAKSTTCATCHGPDGNSILQTYPKIAGQHENYLLKSLIAYQALSTPESEKATNKSATAGIMNAQVAKLTQQDLEDLAAYYSSQKPTVGESTAQGYELGRKLYLGGDIERGIPACAACHSPTGNGNLQAVFPRLSGQQPEYIKAQLMAFKNDERLNDMMQALAKKLDDNDMAAVANFATGLHN